MKTLKVLALALLISFGVFMVIYGEHDDSPGGQGLGVIAVVTGAVGIFKLLRKR